MLTALSDNDRIYYADYISQVIFDHDTQMIMCSEILEQICTFDRITSQTVIILCPFRKVEMKYLVSKPLPSSNVTIETFSGIKHNPVQIKTDCLIIFGAEKLIYCGPCQHDLAVFLQMYSFVI